MDVVYLLESTHMVSPFAQAVRSISCSLEGKMIESLSEFSSPAPLKIDMEGGCWNGQQW